MAISRILKWRIKYNGASLSSIMPIYYFWGKFSSSGSDLNSSEIFKFYDQLLILMSACPQKPIMKFPISVVQGFALFS